MTLERSLVRNPKNLTYVPLTPSFKAGNASQQRKSRIGLRTWPTALGIIGQSVQKSGALSVPVLFHATPSLAQFSGGAQVSGLPSLDFSLIPPYPSFVLRKLQISHLKSKGGNIQETREAKISKFGRLRCKNFLTLYQGSGEVQDDDVVHFSSRAIIMSRPALLHTGDIYLGYLCSPSLLGFETHSD